MKKLAPYLPSRTFTAAFIIPSFTLLAIWMIFDRDAPAVVAAEQQESLIKALDAGIGQYNERDTDGDLLKDWEEFLYETDIALSDTDGDGLSDFDEVLDPIRDPLVPDSEKGRTEPEPETLTSSSTPYYTVDPSLTPTEKFARDVMVTFAQVTRTGASAGALEESLVTKINESALEREKRILRFDLEDLTVMENASASQELRYQQEYQTYARGLAGVRVSDLVLLAYYAETEENEFLNELTKNAILYKDFVDKIADMPVPDSIATTHLAVLNYTDVIARDVEQMSQADQDPLGAMIAAASLTDAETKLAPITSRLQLFFYQI